MISLPRIFAYLFAAAVLSTCTVVTTDNPIGMSGGAQTDARLIGGWAIVRPEVDHEELPWLHRRYVFFLPRKEGGLQALLITWTPGDGSNPGDAEWRTLAILTGIAGNHMVINARPLLKDGEPVEDKDRPLGYLPLLYRFETDGSIQLFRWAYGADQVIDAIQSGHIAGTIEEKGHTGRVRITADPQSLDALFAGAGPRLFPEHFATLQPINSASRSFDASSKFPSFDAYEGPAKPDSEVATVGAGEEAVSITLVRNKDGQPIYALERDGAANPIRLQPGHYQIAFQITYNRCDGCQRSFTEELDLKAGHAYVWTKNEARYVWWFLHERDITGHTLSTTLY